MGTQNSHISKLPHHLSRTSYRNISIGFFFSGLAVRRGKPHEELKKMIDKLGQSSVHSVVFHEEVNILCIWLESVDILTMIRIILIYFIFAVNTYHTYIYLHIICTCFNCIRCIHAWIGYCIYHSNDIVTFNTGYSGGIGCGEIDKEKLRCWHKNLLGSHIVSQRWPPILTGSVSMISIS